MSGVVCGLRWLFVDVCERREEERGGDGVGDGMGMGMGMGTELGIVLGRRKGQEDQRIEGREIER